MENHVEPDEELNRISESIIGSAIDVHKSLGPGFLESIYQRAMEVALTKRGIGFVRQYPFTIYFEGEIVGTGRADLVVENRKNNREGAKSAKEDAKIIGHRSKSDVHR